jgi:alpha-tubulin suppressor-like RCC1 family protein
MASRLPLSEMHNLAQLETLHQAFTIKPISNREMVQKEKKKFENLKIFFNSLDYNTFLSIVLLGGLRGAHLIAVVNSSRKLREFGDRPFYIDTWKGDSIGYYDQYLFRLLLSKKNIAISHYKTPKQTYIDKTIGGEVWSFGYSGEGQLGLSKNNQLNTVVPEKIFNLNNIIEVSCGEKHSVCLDNKGQVWSFGCNSDGQLTNTLLSIYSPKLIPGLNNIINIACGTNTTFCLDNKGRVWSFGQNDFGQLGLGHSNIVDLPTMIPELNNIIQISAENNYTLFLNKKGQVFIAGNMGQLILGDCIMRSFSINPNPSQIPDLVEIVQISTGNNHVLCLDRQEKVWVFGYNRFGQLGLGDKRNRNTPVMIPNLENIVYVSCGSSHSICLDAWGRVWRFGSNENYQLGLNDDINRTFPTLRDDSLNNIIQAISGRYCNLCLDIKGNVRVFGSNENNDINPRKVPTLNSGLNNIIKIACGNNYALCIRKQSE